MSFNALDTVEEAARRLLRSIRYRGPVRCPLCGGGFLSYRAAGMDLEIFKRIRIIGAGRRDNEGCPVCASKARTRLLQLFIQERLASDAKPIRILHFAPEYALYAWLRSCGSRVKYTACDIDPGRYSSVPNVHFADMMSLPFEAGSFDLIICSHVLEHVSDDAGGMSELLRVLSPGGELLALAPFTIDGLGTDEDPSVSDPEERERRFCQFDHVRLYDRDDFVRRLENVGFSVELFDPFTDHCDLARERCLNPLELLPVATKSTM